ncbi:dTDP-fucopyranose mutase [Rhodotorula kratochvilovae]
MPLTRGAVARLHLAQSESGSPAPASLAAESISSTLVSSRDHDSSSDSSDDSDDSSDGDSSSGSETEHEDPTAHLAALLDRAKAAARERDAARAASSKRTGDGDGLAGNDEVVLFGDEADEDDDSEDGDADKGGENSSTPRASTSRALPPSLARPLSRSHPLLSHAAPAAKARSGGISLAQDMGGALADAGAAVVDPQGKGKGKAVDRWGQAPLPHLSKKQLKAKQPHTAGSAWFDMPATPMTADVKRELDALRLSQALDPKRFMRGGAKKDKVGEFFQIGHIIAPSSRATTLASSQRVQKRSFVEDLVESEEARAYARKKTKEVLAKTMSGRKRQRKGGRGAFAMGAGAKK